MNKNEFKRNDGRPWYGNSNVSNTYLIQDGVLYPFYTHVLYSTVRKYRRALELTSISRVRMFLACAYGLTVVDETKHDPSDSSVKRWGHLHSPSPPWQA